MLELYHTIKGLVLISYPHLDPVRNSTDWFGLKSIKLKISNGVDFAKNISIVKQNRQK